MSFHEAYKGPVNIMANEIPKPPKIVIVVAVGIHRELGNKGKLLWHIPEDLKRFKQLTIGHPIIMGRKTFDSIVGYIGTPLPGRTNIVVTRDVAWQYPDVVAVQSIEAALDHARSLNPIEIHIGGGAQIYEHVLPQVDELKLTLVEDAPVADTFFPPYEDQFPRVLAEESHESNGLRYRWIDLAR
jgi:dihydrofolate reductase